MDTFDQNPQPAVQDLEVQGDWNTIGVAGHDVIMGDQYVVEAGADFFRHDLEAIRLEGAPLATSAIADRLRRQPLLVLGGSYEDKPTIARQAARLLAETRAGGAPSAAGARPVLEWNRGNDFEGLLLALRAEEKRAVVLLTGILPRHVGYDLRRLSEAAATAGHAVLATTDVPRSAWKMLPDEEGFWQDLPVDRLFDVSTLASVLVTRLDAVRTSLPEGALLEAREPDLTLLGGVTLRDLAARLHTPANVAVFVQQYAAAAAAGPLTPEDVADLAVAASSEGRRVEKWFHTVLDRHEQLLALGLAFFDGLADDQFFGALERWVAQVREHRDPSLRAYDYGDLDNLESFFTLVGGDAGGTRIEGRWPDLRRALFRAAWRSHRRQVLAALPLVTGLVMESADGAEKDPELYGSADRRYQIRRSVGEALSDVGLMSVASVETALVRLAAEGSPEVQTVAARAMARWREHGADAQLFALFDRWQGDRRIHGMVRDFLAGRPNQKKRGIAAHLDATIAIAVGYAAQYDRPGHLAPQLTALIERFGADRNRYVRSRFRATLPLVVSAHLAQLRPVLREMARNVDLAGTLAESLARACATHPRQVERTLQEWHAECDAARPQTFDLRQVAPREALLMVLALTYGELTYEGGGPLTVEAGFYRLRDILAKEGHPRVRSAVLAAIGRQARSRFATVEPMLQRMVAGVTSHERDEIVRILVGVYREQRAGLEGGEEEVHVGGRRYPVWLESGRPLTAVERAMIRWTRSPDHPVAQAVALQASIAFAQAVDRPEAVQVASIQAEQLQAQAADEAPRVVNAPLRAVALQPGWYTGTFVPWLATRSAPEHRAAVAGLLPEALAQGATNPAGLQFVLARWERLRGEPAAGELAERLRSAMSWHGSAGMLLVFGGFFALVVLLALVTALR
jgi:hypothetical protein